MKKTNPRWVLCFKKLLLVLPFLLLPLANNQVSASEKGTRLSVFLTSGMSYPVGDFDREVKAGFNWGGGAELRFPSSWATGIVFHSARFEHLREGYNAWTRKWWAVDWSFIRGNWYGKYFLMKTGLCPFLKGGIGLYYLEGRNVYQGQNYRISHTTSYSLVPGLGMEYSGRSFFVCIESNYNIVFRNSVGGDLISIVNRQFFDVFLGVGFFIKNP
jgi:hypothetical protein